MGVPADYRGPSRTRLPDLRKEKKEIVERLHEFFEGREVLLAYLFGSLARGEERPLSDVDIAVLLPEEHLPTLFWELFADLRKVLGTERFDLLLLNRASPLLSFSVISEGEVLYFQSEEVLNTFEMETLRRFQDTAYLRRVQNEYLAERERVWFSKRQVSSNG